MWWTHLFRQGYVRGQRQRRGLEQSGVLQVRETNNVCKSYSRQQWCLLAVGCWANSQQYEAGELAAYRSHKDSTCLEVVEDE